METASKIKNDRMNRLLASLGVREIGRDIAETPEKFKESNHGRYDGRTVKDAMQGVNKDNNNDIR